MPVEVRNSSLGVPDATETDRMRALPLLTTSEAASRLRLSPRTLERLRVSGEGPLYLKVGPGKRARVLYRQSDLESWLAQFCYGSTSEYTAQVDESVR